jgi:integrase
VNRRRLTHRGLTLSRIYARRRRYYFFSRFPIENPRTGRIAKWHSLSLISEGEAKARELAAEIIRHNAPAGAGGTFPTHLEAYSLAQLKRREKDRPREPARVKIFEEGQKEYSRICRVIKEAFSDFDVDQVMPVDVAAFLDQWEGQRSAQVYKARLSDFFAWAARKGLRNDNPAREVKVEKPRKRDRLITDAEFHAARDALLLGQDGRPTPSGPMVQAYVDLCYLFYQRLTEIRLLKWSDVQGDSILFTPTKTEKSSGAKVAVPISPAARAVLERLRSMGKLRSIYVIHTLHGQPYSDNGLRTAWKRACARIGVIGATLKDLRAKAASDARRAGFSKEQIRVGLAHTDQAMTETYLRGQDAPVSEVVLELPPRPKK